MERPERQGFRRATGNAPSGDESDTVNIDELTQRHRKAHEQGVRLNIEREMAESELEKCRAEAAELGAGSLDELVALVEKQKADFQEEVSQFEKALCEEEALLASIADELGALDRSGQ